MTIKPRVVDCYYREPIKDSDWTRLVQNGVWGVVLKASEGESFKDPLCQQRRQLAKKAGLRVGFYHFSTPGDVHAQVDNFVEAAQPDKDTLLALDYEPHKTGDMSLEQAEEFCTLVLMRTGQRPALYSGHLIKEKLTKPSAFWARHRLWLAQYASKPKLPPSWSRFFMHQYAADGHGPEERSVNGLMRNADMNTIDVDRATFDRLWAPGDDAAWDLNVQKWLATGSMPPPVSGAPAAPGFVPDVLIIPEPAPPLFNVNATEAGSFVQPPTPGVLQQVEDGLQSLWHTISHR